MGALEAFDRELSQHNADGKDSWYDSGIVFVGKLAADLGSEDLIALRDVWLTRPLPWQKHCAEVLLQASQAETIELLLDMVDRSFPDVSLAALESLRDFDPALFSAEQRQRVRGAFAASQARPISKLHHLVLNAFLDKLQEDKPIDG